MIQALQLFYIVIVLWDLKYLILIVQEIINIYMVEATLGYFLKCLKGESIFPAYGNQSVAVAIYSATVENHLAILGFHLRYQNIFRARSEIKIISRADNKYEILFSQLFISRLVSI